MSRFFQQVLLIILCSICTHRAEAFALLGPYEQWQTPALGYNPLGGEVGGPHKLGEGYRWNQSTITYAYDPTFLNYFGIEGTNAVDQAIAIITNAFGGGVSTFSRNLEEFPLDAKRFNYRAGAIGLLDLKTTALGLLLEELGLASPERYAWALRSRNVVNNNTATNYLVVPLNFDPIDHSPTPYVNGTRYTYQVLSFPGPPGFEDAVEFRVDQTRFSFSSAASIADSLFSAILPGEYFTGLTRDDAAGLQYLYSRGNLAVENTIANTFQYGPDLSQTVLITNLDLALFSSLSLTSTPAQLLANTNFPGLIIDRTNIIGATNVFTPVVTFTNIGSFFVNSNNLTIVTNDDLFAFSSFSLTNTPAALFARYPGLIATSTNVSITNMLVSLSVTTNLGVDPWGSPNSFRLVLVTNFGTNLIQVYHYTFANVLTNLSTLKPATLVDLQTLELDRAPYGDPFGPLITNVFHQSYVTNLPSGNFAILPGNTVGYVPIGSEIFNIYSITNNLIPPLIFGTAGIIFQQDQVYRYTNVQFAAYPIELTGAASQVAVTNNVLTPVLLYENSYPNIRTNYVFPSGIVTVETIRITPDPRPGFPSSTSNIALPVSFPSNFVNGGFVILPPNFIDYNLSPILTNVLPVTNIVLDVINPITGVEDRQQIIHYFTNVVYLASPIVLQPANPTDLRPGVEALKFVKVHYDSLVGNGFAYTNTYTAVTITNGAYITNSYRVVQTQPDIVFSAKDLGTFNAPSVAPVRAGRTQGWVNNSALNTQNPDPFPPSPQGGLGGPGIIQPTISIIFTKLDHSIISTVPGAETEETSLGIFSFNTFLWGSFDGTTNAPIVYPKDITIEDLEHRVLGITH